MPSPKVIKTRIPPSPTGLMHIGTLRQVLWNYMWARKHHGLFLLRIEDTDQSRSVEGSIENIIKILQKTGLVPDEGPVPFPDLGHGPYIQSERLPIYRQYADRMLENGTAYACFCSSERLDTIRAEQESLGLPTKYDGCCRDLPSEVARERIAALEPHTVRLRVPRGETLVFEDGIRGRIEFRTNDTDDQVLMKTDGFPTYHLAVVVDDELMEVTDALRGEEWLPSMPKQILIARALGITLPTYYHAPLILGSDRKKLSKRTGDVAVEEYFRKGYLVPALLNYIAFLGWSPKTTEEIFSLDELTERFDFTDVHRAGAVFDPDRLDWMNTQYLAVLSDEALYDALTDYLAEYDHEFYCNVFILRDRAMTVRIVREIRGRMHRFEEYRELSRCIYHEPEDIPLERFLHEKMQVRTEADVIDALVFAHDILQSLGTIDDIEALKAVFLPRIAEAGKKNGQILYPLRVALSGELSSPGAFELVILLGHTEMLARLQKSLAKLGSFV